MIGGDAIVAGNAARDEAKAYLRIDGTTEDVLIDRLVAVAIGHGEGFTGQMLIARTVRETMAASGPEPGRWRRLARTPVTAITAVEGLAVDGTAAAMSTATYAIDIDGNGDGWVRATGAGSVTRVRVTYTAGIAAGWATLPEALRQGAIRLAAHLYSHRDAADEPPPPAAVAALWRPWRRMRLS